MTSANDVREIASDAKGESIDTLNRLGLFTKADLATFTGLAQDAITAMTGQEFDRLAELLAKASAPLDVGERARVRRVAFPGSHPSRKWVGRSSLVRKVTFDVAGGFWVYRFKNIPGEWFDDEIERA